MRGGRIEMEREGGSRVEREGGESRGREESRVEKEKVE